MRVAQQSRRTGKTTMMLDWLSAYPDDRILVVMNEREAERLRLEAKERGIVRPRIVAVHHLFTRNHLRPTDQVAVDELDAVLAVLLGHPVDLATLSPSERFLEPPLRVRAMRHEGKD